MRTNLVGLVCRPPNQRPNNMKNTLLQKVLGQVQKSLHLYQPSARIVLKIVNNLYWKVGTDNAHTVPHEVSSTPFMG